MHICNLQTSLYNNNKRGEKTATIPLLLLLFIYSTIAPRIPSRFPNERAALTYSCCFAVASSVDDECMYVESSLGYLDHILSLVIPMEH